METCQGASIPSIWVYSSVSLITPYGKLPTRSGEEPQNKVKRDGGLKGKAVTALMRKLALSLWHVAQGKRFDTSKLFDARALGIET